MNIGDLAKATGIKVGAIRYYEQIGIMSAPARTNGNYRAYLPAHLNRLLFIRRCRELGFTLDELRDLLHLRGQAEQECAAVDRITARHLKEIEQRIADLQKLVSELRRIQTRCSGKSRVANCRIIEALSSYSKPTM